MEDLARTNTRKAHLEHLRIILSQEGTYCPIAQPVRLLGHVFLGNINNAESYPTLKRHNISHVLNCAGYKGPRSYTGSPYAGLNIDYVEIFAEDKDGYDITQHFRAAFRYLDNVLTERGRALVHCAMGINRSVAICVGYMLEHLNMSLIQAIALIRDKRPVILTNFSFAEQLYDWAAARGQLGSSYQWHNSMLKHNTLGMLLPTKLATEEEQCSRRRSLPLKAYATNSHKYGGLGSSVQMNRPKVENKRVKGLEYKNHDNSSSVFEEYMKQVRERLF